MQSEIEREAFDKKVLMIGCGSVGQCTLPLLLRHIDMPASRITAIDFEDRREAIGSALEAGVCFNRERITPENLESLLAKYVGPGDMIVDLSWNIDALRILGWCHDNQVRYINTSVEEWDPYHDLENKSPHVRSLYFRQMELRQMRSAWQSEGTYPGATAIVDHGANPGLVNHFAKRALMEISGEMIEKGVAPAVDIDEGEFRRLRSEAADEIPGAFARLSQATGTKVIHISERDTQISDRPKKVNEFVNTWSIEGFYEEGTAPAELGWGTHERRLPKHAHVPEGGPGNQIYIAQPGIRTLVYSWVPKGGQIVGMIVRHAEAFTISDFLTVWEDAEREVRRPIYRPTVHYAYMPCDNAILSLYELVARSYKMQEELRIMDDEIIDGMDELGVLLLGHGLNGWWVGSQLDIHEARELVPGQNATTLQVAAAVLAGVLYMIRNPERGLLCPEDLPHREILASAAPYLGPLPSVHTDWTPLKHRWPSYEKWGRHRPREEDIWQFESFLVE